MALAAKSKFLIGGAIVVGSAAWLMYNSIRSTAVYFLSPQEFAARLAVDSTFRSTGIKLGARVVPNSIERKPGGREVAFRVTDGVQTYPVVYRGVIPDTFTDSADIVVDGRLDPSGTFRATTLLAKCGSRFESAPSPAHQQLMRQRS